MPWPWELCVHCMDLQKGSFLHWPLPGTWLDNRAVLNAMYDTWEAWRYCIRINDPKYTVWTPADVDYASWLEEGKPHVAIISKGEAWARQQGLLDG